MLPGRQTPPRAAGTRQAFSLLHICTIVTAPAARAWSTNGRMVSSRSAALALPGGRCGLGSLIDQTAIPSADDRLQKGGARTQAESVFASASASRAA
jgi:hypothetical protein